MKGENSMIQVFRIIYVALIGSLVFYMFRRGGCCGGYGHHHQKSNRGRADYDINKSRKVINDDEKNNAIDI